MCPEKPLTDFSRSLYNVEIRAINKHPRLLEAGLNIRSQEVRVGPLANQVLPLDAAHPAHV